MTLGERLLRLRTKSGLSQDSLADILGVSRQAVSKWERDEASPDVDNLMKISDYFGVTVDYLLRGPDPSQDGSQTPGGSQTDSQEHQPDTFDKLGTLIKTKWYYIGYLLIAWGVFNLVQFVIVLLFTVIPISGTFGLSNIFQLFLSFPMLIFLYSGLKIAVGILIIKYGKRRAAKG